MNYYEGKRKLVGFKIKNEEFKLRVCDIKERLPILRKLARLKRMASLLDKKVIQIREGLKWESYS